MRTALKRILLLILLSLINFLTTAIAARNGAMTEDSQQIKSRLEALIRERYFDRDLIFELSNVKRVKIKDYIRIKQQIHSKIKSYGLHDALEFEGFIFAKGQFKIRYWGDRAYFIQGLSEVKLTTFGALSVIPENSARAPRQQPPRRQSRHEPTCC